MTRVQRKNIGKIFNLENNKNTRK